MTQPAMPETFAHFARYLNVPPPLARTFWTALCQARWSAAVALRQAFALRHGIKDSLGAPAQVVDAIEALVHERHLTRHEATRLEEQILRSTDKTGRWLSRMQREALPHQRHRITKGAV